MDHSNNQRNQRKNYKQKIEELKFKLFEEISNEAFSEYDSI